MMDNPWVPTDPCADDQPWTCPRCGDTFDGEPEGCRDPLCPWPPFRPERPDA